MASLGNSQGYRYAHDEPEGYPAGSDHDCWPEGVPRTRFFEPSDHGQEKRFREMMAYRAELDRRHDESGD